MKTLRILLLLLIAALLAACDDTPTPRHFNPRIIHSVDPIPVNSTWRFETAYSPKNIVSASLALDSHGNPHIAYGGDQLYYAWFDGSTWQHDVPDTTPGAGVDVHLFLDSADQPHFLYSAGSIYTPALLHTYRNQAGWQHETIFSTFCLKTISDAAIDPQGRLVVVFHGSLSCYESNIETQHIWYAQQAPNGWDVTLVSDSGMSASLAFDSSGQPFLSYYDASLGRLTAAARSGSVWAIEMVTDEIRNAISSLPFFDAQGTLHIIYQISSGGSSYRHAWKDTSGWRSEVIQNLSFPSRMIALLNGTQGEITLACISEQSSLFLIRQDPDGWRLEPVFAAPPGQKNQLGFSSIKMDRLGRLHLLYKTYPDQSLVYSVRERETWQPTLIDHGGTFSQSHTGLAFDPTGQLVMSFYSSDGSIHYLWKDDGKWRDETVAAAVEEWTSYPIHILFDPENRPHLIYVAYSTGDKLPTFAHAVRENGRWTAELLPVWVKAGGDWSVPGFSPEGWPVLLDAARINDQMVAILVYRNSSGWNNQNLADIYPRISSEANPQYAYPPLKTARSTSQGGISLPAFVYSIAKTNETAYFDPRKNKQTILPVLDTYQYADHYALDFDPQGKPVIFLHQYQQVNGSRTGQNQLLSITQAGNGWQATQINGIGASDINAPFLDRQGQAHFASWFTYVTGSGANWKMTPIQAPGLDLDPRTVFPIAQALSEDGAFCVEFYDYTANDLLIGCLENLE
jgi:hypothetical protein